MNTVKYIFYTITLIFSYNAFGMHALSQVGREEAQFTSLGLQYVPENTQQEYFFYLGKGETNHPTFKSLVRKALNCKNPQFRKVLAAEYINTNSKAYIRNKENYQL